MPFVARDSEGNITAVRDEPTAEAVEELPADDPQVVAFLSQPTEQQGVKQRLVESDADMARVTEDLIETLIEKHVILLTDLPRTAQEKLLKRRRLRERMSSLISLVDSDDLL